MERNKQKWGETGINWKNQEKTRKKERKLNNNNKKRNKK